MAHIYFLKRGWAFFALILFFDGIQQVYAQQNSTPFEQVFITANISKEGIKKDFPHLYQVVKQPGYKTEDVNAFIKAHGTEWTSFCNLPALKKLNIAWSTLGITTIEAKQQFPHSIYQWFKAANVSEAQKSQLFPHFPVPNLKNDVTRELADYEQKIGTWQRLYPEEYERFLNAPELTAINPYYTGYYKLPYMPKFIGTDIGLDKPVKESTSIMDEYQYQLKLRNWYFVFKPAEFNKLYGNDYKFPDSFNQQEYRDNVIRVLNGKKAGTYPDMTNPH